ncbi:MAG: hypothetical protein M4D80_02300 [Myxococcota bacterium]|nr:hypothetical protein [Deltaproteobacteria bacterium]MDQ3333964.1 hypothetical protein [Myxococcota bacterium]
MSDWVFFAGLAAGAAFLAGRGLLGRRQTEAAANASGLVPVRDLSHIPEALQRSALWSMAEGGFESRVVHGVISKGAEDVDVTAFDLETLRERRGEWAYLPVEPPFRIAGTVSIVVCEIDRMFPHFVLKRAGHGDDMHDDDLLERGASIAKLARGGLGMARSHPAEMPPALGGRLLDVTLASNWRAYGTDPLVLNELVVAGLNETLRRADRRDLVVELLEGLVIVYPAARDVDGADAFADLTTTALGIVEGVMAASPRVTPRGVDSHRPLHSRDGNEAD